MNNDYSETVCSYMIFDSLFTINSMKGKIHSRVGDEGNCSEMVGTVVDVAAEVDVLW